MLDKLGEGGMGVVFSAYDPQLDRKVAIKLLRTSGLFSRLGTEQARERLLREAKAMAKLRHPNVITVYEVGAHGDRVYIAMEYVDGSTLSMWVDALREDDELDEIIRMFGEAGKGLAAAHAAGIVHRDFKPDNVLVGSDGRVQVTDFGIAGVGDQSEPPPADIGDAAPPASITQTGDILGTPVFMAPEQHFAEPTDPRTDQFSFCLALWHALYGDMPFEGENDIVLGLAKKEGALRPPPDGARARISPRVHAALERGLSGDPGDRFDSLRQLLAELAPRPKRGRRWIGVVAAAIPIAGLLAWTIQSAARDDGAARDAALAAARDCDCSLLRFSPGAEITAIRPVPGRAGERAWAPGESLALAAALQPTGQYAVPRGYYVVDYAVGGRASRFGVRSDGFGTDRSFELPAPVDAPGFRFLAGGEVRVGDVLGTEDESERPASEMVLAPYLIAVKPHARTGNRFASPAIFSFDEAVEAAARAGSRLPTAAEWEWAATLGAFAIDDEAEWTATQSRPYPYVDDGRDNPLIRGETAEIRGRYHPSWRGAGNRIGGARLRLARDAAAARLAPLELRVVGDASPGAVELRKLGAYISRWLRSSDTSVIAAAGSECRGYTTAVSDAGVSARAFQITDEGPGCRFSIHAEPDPAWDPMRMVIHDTKIDILETIRFVGAEPTPESAPIIEAVASTLEGNRDIRKMEVGVWVSRREPHPDHMALSLQRARRVRERLIELGVEPERLSARGNGDQQKPSCIENPPPERRTAKQASALLDAARPIRFCGLAPELEPVTVGRVEFLLLQRGSDGETPAEPTP